MRLVRCACLSHVERPYVCIQACRKNHPTSLERMTEGGIIAGEGWAAQPPHGTSLLLSHTEMSWTFAIGSSLVQQQLLEVMHTSPSVVRVSSCTGPHRPCPTAGGKLRLSCRPRSTVDCCYSQHLEFSSRGVSGGRPKLGLGKTRLHPGALPRHHASRIPVSRAFRSPDPTTFEAEFASTSSPATLNPSRHNFDTVDRSDRHKGQGDRGNKGDWLGMADPQESEARLFRFGRKVNTDTG